MGPLKSDNINRYQIMRLKLKKIKLPGQGCQQRRRSVERDSLVGSIDDVTGATPQISTRRNMSGQSHSLVFFTVRPSYQSL